MSTYIFFMKNILWKLINILIVSLLILLPLINSHLFDLIWLKFWVYVDWNYEFSKAIFFNILSWIIVILFFLKNINKKIIIPKILYIISLILILSSFFSSFPITSLFWESWKWHWIILFLNLIWLSVIFINQKESDFKKYINYWIFWLIFVIFFWIKEYYFPTFDYWNLSNRAIWTFGHPNFLALYLLIFIPLIIKNIKESKIKKSKFLNYTLLLFIIFTLLITQSIWWIFIFFIYIILLEYLKHKKKINKKYLWIFAILLVFILSYIIYNFWIITKLSSFLSRFYIWKTTIVIIFSDIKNLIFWLWADTLRYTFDTYKLGELYIYENIWFTADRPHNLLLNLFYHFWIFWLIFYLYFIYNILKKIRKKTVENKNIFYIHTIILFLIFTVFNFSSISVYLIIVLLLTIIFKNNYKKINSLYFLPFVFISLLSIYWSYSYYLEEHRNFTQKWYISENKYYNKIILENPEKKVFKESSSLENICYNLLNIAKSAENFFYCWNLFWNYDKENAIILYKLWLEKIPNIWDEKSDYYNNNLIKKLFVPERFYSEKFSNIKEILERVKIKN